MGSVTGSSPLELIPVTFVTELPPAGRPRTGPKSKTCQRAEELKAHPGEWAVWPNTQSASQVRRRLAPLGRFQATQRGGIVYVRYLGPEAGSVPPTVPGPAVPKPPEHKALPVRPLDRTTCPGCLCTVRPRTGETFKSALSPHARTRPLCRSATAC